MRSTIGRWSPTSRPPGIAARAALEQLIAWKAERRGIDPLGSGRYTNPVSGIQLTFANIAGHRDLATTECPGGTFYDTLPALRQAVATRIAESDGTPATVLRSPGHGLGADRVGRVAQLDSAT